MSKQNNRPSNKFRWVTRIVIAVALVLVFAASALAFGAHLENNDAFCASCHTQPETTFVERTTAPAVDLASAHTPEQVGCIHCHSGTGMPGRLSAMELGARDLAAYAGGSYPQPSKLKHPIPDENCLKCHDKISTGNNFENHFHILLPRWQKFDPQGAATCVSCHSAHTTDGMPSLNWLNKERTVAQCNNCHRVMGD